MRSIFTPRTPPPTPSAQPCPECALLEAAWQADEERILSDMHTIARLTGALRRLRAAVALHPPYGSKDEQTAFHALLAQVDAVLDTQP